MVTSYFDISHNNYYEIISFCFKKSIDLFVIGPSNPLINRIADVLRAKGIMIFGPSRGTARLEGSKGLLKDFSSEFNIPTAAYIQFSKRDEAINYFKKQKFQIVVKTDGLAASEGIVIA
ncbi:MAG: Phosphoribosylamine--glycine ligase [Hyphomicrobiaceae bacterium hypho_1]